MPALFLFFSGERLPLGYNSQLSGLVHGRTLWEQMGMGGKWKLLTAYRNRIDLLELNERKIVF